MTTTSYESRKESHQQDRKKKAWTMVSNTMSTLLIVVLLGMTILVLSARASGGEPELFGYQVKTVLSGSMEPAFDTGSVIIVKQMENPNAISKGDVITYKQSNSQLVTHRVIEVINQGEATQFRTKGDNNKNPDMNLVLPQNVTAKYTGITVPFIGYLLGYASTPLGVALLLIVPGIMLLAYSIFTIHRALKEIEQTTKDSKTEEQTIA
ncbi:signal peptidase I SipW [Virgibacillus sp. LDC-1]|uniref:signal peptidase I SipW n=1 Tax=Virgibacillus sp. LDC-1 TaxID=3039856 RepID=UPI0024DEDA04|nr:signal peptidase I [Virgibacillus sp. LDC-1]